MAHDLIKKKVIFLRTRMSTYASIAVEFPIGIGQVVSLIAIHWHLEQVKSSTGAGLLMAALSENPEHLANPPIGVAEFQGDPDMYGMATWASFSLVNGSDWARDSVTHSLIVPLYGMLRPKRQIAVFANVWVDYTGVRGEIYYEEETPSSEVVNAISRRYGKYRRT